MSIYQYVKESNEKIPKQHQFVFINAKMLLTNLFTTDVILWWTLSSLCHLWTTLMKTKFFFNNDVINGPMSTCSSLLDSISREETVTTHWRRSFTARGVSFRFHSWEPVVTFSKMEDKLYQGGNKRTSVLLVLLCTSCTSW